MDFFLISILSLILVSLYFAFTLHPPYSNNKTENRIKKSDYSVLSASVLFIFCCIYTELKYKLLGEKIGFEVLIISLFFILASYYFDHLFLLSISLTGLATSIELISNPLDVFNPVSFDKSETCFSILFGISLVLAARIFEKKNIKKHFTYTYFNFAANLIYIYCTLGIFQSEDKIEYSLILLASSLYFVRYSFKEKSKFFVLISIFYPYIGFTYFVFIYWIPISRINLILFFILSIFVFIFFYFIIRNLFLKTEKN